MPYHIMCFVTTLARKVPHTHEFHVAGVSHGTHWIMTNANAYRNV